MKVSLFISIAFLFSFMACVQYDFEYDLNTPVAKFVLSDDLEEISGLAYIDENTIAAVQDEDGAIFLIDSNSGEIKDEIQFGKNGDYEGITYCHGKYWVLRSDGTLFKVRNNKEPKKFSFNDKKGFDFEGLCYDEKNERLLIACKSHKKKDKNKYIYIYGFSLKDKKFEDKPVLKISKEKIHPRFKPSGIAIHPNGDIYILSAFSNTLVVLSESGDLKSVVPLIVKNFQQAEGITFTPDGDLYISNEKHFRAPTLLKFTYLRD